MNSIAATALQYYDFGWCIIPVPYKKKDTYVKWTPYQTRRPDRMQVQKWFGRGQCNVAVVVGAVSGGLACRDFDVEGSYHAWAKARPELSGRLATARTARGFHVYFRADIEGIRKLPDGELRGSRCYCMLPPSVHPDGPTYNMDHRAERGQPFSCRSCLGRLPATGQPRHRDHRDYEEDGDTREIPLPPSNLFSSLWASLCHPNRREYSSCHRANPTGGNLHTSQARVRLCA